MTLETDIGCLKQLPLFQSLPTPRLKLVTLMGEKLRFEPGTRIIAEGEEPEGVYVLLQGAVDILHERSDGPSRRFPLATGSIIGDVAMLCGHGFVGEVVAKTQVTMLRLPKDLFFELLENVPDFSMALSRDLASRLYRLADAVLHNKHIH